MAQTLDAILKSSQKAVEISLSLIGIMAFWLGIVNIAQNSGLMELFSKLIKKPLLKIFPDLKENNEAISNIALNISANALGLMNAATPFGIKAMENMQEKNQNKNYATNSMCTFLAINTAGFQIVPAVVLAILSANGMSNPTQIIIPTLIVTSIAFISALVFSKILERVFK
ncbi:MAG: hypothetical protein IKU37_08215 [Candidatus Gastranaerophilales bacterium]|nr:hypothetical protein [Candidatus Gastranaerophilales bacterium]